MGIRNLSILGHKSWATEKELAGRLRAINELLGFLQNCFRDGCPSFAFQILNEYKPSFGKSTIIYPPEVLD